MAYLAPLKSMITFSSSTVEEWKSRREENLSPVRNDDHKRTQHPLNVHCQKAPYKHVLLLPLRVKIKKEKKKEKRKKKRIYE